jgi:hypothetical protein
MNLLRHLRLSQIRMDVTADQDGAHSIGVPDEIASGVECRLHQARLEAVEMDAGIAQASQFDHCCADQ